MSSSSRMLMKTNEVLGNPLWFTPVMLLMVLVMIEGLHTMAHLHGEIDVHGLCRQNKEYIEMKEQEDY